MTPTHRSHDMTDKLRDELLKRADELDPVLEVEFDTQRCVEQNPYGATEAIEKALFLIRDMRVALAAAPQPAPDREALVEVIMESSYLPPEEAGPLADALLARGLRLPAPETMACKHCGEKQRLEYLECTECGKCGDVRVVEGGDDAA